MKRSFHIACAVALLCGLCLLSLAARAGTVRLEQTESADGGVEVSLHYLREEGESPAGFQFDLQYDNNAYALTDVVSGDAAFDAGKDVVSSHPYNNTARVMVVGFGPDAIGEGVLVTLHFYPTDWSTERGDSLLDPLISNVVGSDARGETVSLAPEDATPGVDKADETDESDGKSAAESSEASVIAPAASDPVEGAFPSPKYTTSVSNRQTDRSELSGQAGFHPGWASQPVRQPQNAQSEQATISSNLVKRHGRAVSRSTVPDAPSTIMQGDARRATDGWRYDTRMKMAAVAPRAAVTGIPESSLNAEPSVRLPGTTRPRPSYLTWMFLVPCAFLIPTAIFSVRRVVFPRG